MGGRPEWGSLVWCWGFILGGSLPEEAIVSSAGRDDILNDIPPLMEDEHNETEGLGQKPGYEVVDEREEAGEAEFEAGEESGYAGDGEAAQDEQGEEGGEEDVGEGSGGGNNDSETIIRGMERTLLTMRDRNLELESRLAQVLQSYRNLEEETSRVRERLERDRVRRLALEKQKLFSGLLEPLDNLDRSLTASGSESDTPLAAGVRLVWRQMIEVFRASGLERFEPKGEPFDPEQHDALGMIAAAEELDGRVAQVELAGYRLDGELLRPARVLVGRKG